MYIKTTKILSFKLFESYSFLSKQNNYVQLFQKLEDEGLAEDEAKSLWIDIYGNRQAIKNQNREKKLQDAQNLEEVEDILVRVKLVSRATQWTKLMPSLLRGDVKNRIEEFADIIINYNEYNDFKKSFMKKVARYDDVDSFFKGLKNHINGITDDYDKILKKIEATDGADIHKILSKQIIAWIYTGKASKSLASQQWCIISPSTFYSYLLDKNNTKIGKQYFIWDFEYETTDNKHRIGVTIGDNDRVGYAHFSNDYDATKYIKTKDWNKYLTSITPDEINKFIHATSSTDDAGISLKLALVVNDYNLVNDIINNMPKTTKTNSYDFPRQEIVKLAYKTKNYSIIEKLVKDFDTDFSRTGQILTSTAIEDKNFNLLNYFINILNIKIDNTLSSELIDKAIQQNDLMFLKTLILDYKLSITHNTSVKLIKDAIQKNELTQLNFLLNTLNLTIDKDEYLDLGINAINNNNSEIINIFLKNSNFNPILSTGILVRLADDKGFDDIKQSLINAVSPDLKNIIGEIAKSDQYINNKDMQHLYRLLFN